jgi:hypothetical protein
LPPQEQGAERPASHSRAVLPVDSAGSSRAELTGGGHGVSTSHSGADQGELPRRHGSDQLGIARSCPKTSTGAEVLAPSRDGGGSGLGRLDFPAETTVLTASFSVCWFPQGRGTYISADDHLRDYSGENASRSHAGGSVVLSSFLPASWERR